MAEEGISARDFPEFIEKTARLAHMDREGVPAAVMLPTIGVVVEHGLESEPDVLYANVRSFNRWIQEEWGYGDDGRIYGVPILSLASPAAAAVELDRLLAEGARLVYVRPAPVDGKSPADPAFDPVWSRLNESGIPVAFHVGDADAVFAGRFAAQWGESTTPRLHNMSGFQWFTCNAERPITDTIAALIFHNLFERFPKLRVLSIENGSSWVGPALKNMDKAFRQTYGRASSHSNGKETYGKVNALPSELFKQHIWVSPFVEEDVPALCATIGSERVICGSDYPHPEGAASPRGYADRVAAAMGDQKDEVLNGNMFGLLNGER